MQPDHTNPNNKPKCQYGSKCYRKNPQHRKEFWHPGEDEDGTAVVSQCVPCTDSRGHGRKRPADDDWVSEDDAPPAKARKKIPVPKNDEPSSSSDDYKTEDDSQDDDEEDDDDEGFIDDGSETDIATDDDSPPQKPICQYGKNCYRKNPQHFIDFAHPWKDDK